MHLSDLNNPEIILPKNANKIPIKSITSDSRKLTKDCMFVAIKGYEKDGHDFIDEAISGGASNILVDYNYKVTKQLPLSKSKNVRKALALVASIYFNKQPNIIAAVTGTNGKTSVCTFLKQIWDLNNFTSASLGTLGLNASKEVKHKETQNENLTTLLLATFAIGIGIGSLACEKLSKNTIELGIIPIGAIGLSLFTFDLFLFSSDVSMNHPITAKNFISDINNWRLIFDLTMIGASGGIFSVPFYAAIQDRANPKYLSRIIAANNIINAIFMVSASILAITFLSIGFSIPEFFILISLMNIFMIIYLNFTSELFFIRFMRLMKSLPNFDKKIKDKL